jgi:membrane protein
VTAAEPGSTVDDAPPHWWGAVRRTVSESRDDNLTDWAAALTYYSVLSLFPALIAAVSIVGLVGDPAAVTRTVTEIVGKLSPGTAAKTVSGPIESITSNRGAAGVLLIVGFGVALWTASGYVGAFARVSNAIYDVEEDRPVWKLRPLQLLVTLVIILLLALVALGLVLTGPLASAVGGTLGVGEVAVTAWNVVKLPVLAAVVLTVVALLYQVSPNVSRGRFRWISPGSVLALAVWIAASAAFGLYVANFGSYNKTYGTLGGVVTFLVWVWITNLVILFGLELNRELERRGKAQTGEAHTDDAEAGLDPDVREAHEDRRSPQTA